MLSLQLRSKLEFKKLAGHKLKRSEVTVLLNQNAKVYKPDGELLCVLVRGGIPSDVSEVAYPALHELKKYKTDNRGSYSGGGRVTTEFADGHVSHSNRTRTGDGEIMSVSSAIVGYFDRMGGRFPYCRATAFTATEVEKWATIVPMAQHVAGVFEELLPERFEKQRAIAAKTRPEYVIKGTPFTTLTVNNNVVAATHQDKGDYKDGFGIISCHRRGNYQGAWLGFTEYGVAADLQDGDLFFFNSHDWHALTPFENAEEGYERISIVYYFRERMVQCGSPAEELARAKKVRGTIA